MDELETLSIEPVGTVKELPILQQFLDALREKWAACKVGTAGWIGINWRGLVKGVVFVIQSVDELIKKIDDLIPDGADKKATVMAIATLLYSEAIAPMFPIWMKPFAGMIQTVIVDIIISYVVDFIVGKYNSGAWMMHKA